ncbi:Resolvase family protein (fragment) [Agrobacterium tumefaciens str. CFBP 5621]|uniref:recombinase family protein n=1 Tax=Agrobacterium tumefaciens TaxID=358 RepID=UPI0009B99780
MSGKGGRQAIAQGKLDGLCGVYSIINSIGLIEKKPVREQDRKDLFVYLVDSIAEFERELMLERQREGIARAKAEGKYRGRAPTARAKSDEVVRMKATGMTADLIAMKLGIGRASVFRILKNNSS